MPEEREAVRKLRPKEHKVYVDEVDDDEIEGGKREFSVEEKLKSSKFANQKMLKVMSGHEVNVRYFQENGFKYPIVVKQKDGLGIRIPGENFTVTDVKQCVGSRRHVDVMDVNTQKGEEMTMKEWVSYYMNKERSRLLNVISLEFSHTRLENYVEQPTVVKQLDWVETAWPIFLKESQTETTNIIEKMKYPKVQKYVLMSVAGCYTDFHIDMGGTSVWYHILHGQKVFWVIPPTVENLDLYEKWVKSGRQGDIFFGDKATDCMRIQLEKGYTFFIPTGWIHAVYTPLDSLVFGGNFLQSINIDMQLNIWDIESRTHVPSKFRYPFFTEIHWYVLDRYLSCVYGKSYRIKSAEEMKADREDDEYEEAKVKDEPDKSEGKTEEDTADYTPPRTPMEDDASSVTSTRGRSHGRPGTPHSVTEDTSRPGTPDSRTSRQSRSSGRGSKSKSLMQTDLDRIRPVSVKLENCMLMDRNKLMAKDSMEKKAWVHLTRYELEGLQQVVDWCENLPPTKKLVPKDIVDPDGLLADMKLMIKDHIGDNPNESLTGDLAIKWPVRKKTKVKVRTYTTSFPRPKHPKGPRPSGASSIRRRRVRCKKCEPCTRSNCEMCTFCKDMKKYGGPGTMKQSCISRQCIRPELPSCISCLICSKSDSADPGDEDLPLDTLLECAICYEIAHPRCHKEKNSSLAADGLVNEDLPNSWECAKCVEDGKQGWAKDEFYCDSPGTMSMDDISPNTSQQNVELPDLPGPSTSYIMDCPPPDPQASTSDQPSAPESSPNTNQSPVAEAPIDAATANENSQGTEPCAKKKRDSSPTPPPPDLTESLSNLPASMQVKPKAPKYVVRPGPVPPPPKHVLTEFGTQHALDGTIWMFVFKLLMQPDLSRCMRVCKTWNRWCLDPFLWRDIDLSHTRIRQVHLIGIVRRQPRVLNFRGANISRPQLAWLVARIPHLKVLNLHSSSWAAVNALCSSTCPLLHTLDLSWVDSVWDACITDLMSPPTDHRPGVDESLSRFRRCSELSLIGTNITDKALEVIATYLPRIEKLDLGYCPGVTDKGLDILSGEGSVCRASIKDLGLVCLSRLTDDCFIHLAQFPGLENVNFSQCPRITHDACLKFIERSTNKNLAMVAELWISSAK